MNLKHAVNEAIDECIHQDIMADFLRRNRAEVVKMSIYEYDEEKKLQNAPGAILEYGARAWQERRNGRGNGSGEELKEELREELRENLKKQYV